MALATVTGSLHGHGMRRQRIMPQRQEVSRRTPCPYDDGYRTGMRCEHFSNNRQLARHQVRLRKVKQYNVARTHGL